MSFRRAGGTRRDPDVASCGTRSTASSTSSQTKPVTPSTTISGTDPMFAPSTGVPHAIASIIVRPKRSGRVVMCTSASALLKQLVARFAFDRTEKLNLIAVDVRLDALAKIRFVLRNRRDLQAYAGALGDLDRQMRSFFGMKAPEKDEIVARVRVEREFVRIDAVVRRRRDTTGPDRDRRC